MLTLVTGAAGFIASNLCHFLVNQGHKVIGIDALLEGSNIHNLDGLKDTSFEFVHLDLRDDESLVELFKLYSFRYVYHLAAQTHVDRSFSNIKEFWDCNVLGTTNLFRTCLSFGKVEKIINQGTDECFGPTFSPCGEESVFSTTNPYAGQRRPNILQASLYIIVMVFLFYLPSLQIPMDQDSGQKNLSGNSYVTF